MTEEHARTIVAALLDTIEIGRVIDQSRAAASAAGLPPLAPPHLYERHAAAFDAAVKALVEATS